MRCTTAIVTILLFLAGSSCRTIKFKGKDGGDQQAEGRPSEESPDLPDYSLICAVKQPATDQDLHALTACAMVDQNGRKAVLPDIAETWRWGFAVAPEKQVMVETEELPSQEAFHVFYHVRGESAVTINEAINSIQISLNLLLKGGQESRAAERATIGDVRDDSYNPRLGEDRPPGQP